LFVLLALSTLQHLIKVTKIIVMQLDTVMIYIFNAICRGLLSMICGEKLFVRFVDIGRIIDHVTA
jgi:hypothetical protein